MVISFIVIFIVQTITQALLHYYTYKFRGTKGRKAAFITHNNRLELVWTVIPAIVLFVLILVSSNFKRVYWIITMAGIIILVGHYIDVYNMIMPSAVGDKWGFGIPELASLMFFAGLFIFIVFSTLTKAPLEAKGDPFNEESKKFIYPF